MESVSLAANKAPRGNLRIVLALTVCIPVVWKLFSFVHSRLTSPLRKLPGPPGAHWLFGNLKQLREAHDRVALDEWAEKYGSAVNFGAFMNSPTLFTLDPRAIHYVLTHSMDYRKPESARRSLAKLLGEGLVVVEGEQHRQQRRILNPAFGPVQIRALTDIFVRKATELGDVWLAEVSLSEPARIDVFEGLTSMTLDVIGLAGFCQDLGSLTRNEEPGELSAALNEILTVPEKISPLIVLQAMSPVFDVFKDETLRRFDRAQEFIRRTGLQLIAERQAAILREATEKDIDLGDSLKSRDLLTLLLKANMAKDIPDSQRLSDENILNQVLTFLVAGHETTSTATAWCLFGLSQSPRVQSKLREELLGVETDSPTMDELSALPYLDMVVRETLRFHAPVASTTRVATKDDTIPLGTSFTDLDGKVRNSNHVNAGTEILIPISAVNTSKALWGDDAHGFIPERWANPPESVSSIPGIWSHMLTFLGGPRACIGYRFAIIEMKALIFILIRAYEFSMAVEPAEIKKTPGLVERPMVVGQRGRSQLPLLVKQYGTS
ncbi:cytochrome P450 [Pilatotrama ljubarskyi]|nr:cytochrome P450 [Pilatotrama ljubarskyi]